MRSIQNLESYRDDKKRALSGGSLKFLNARVSCIPISDVVLSAQPVAGLICMSQAKIV